MRCTLLYSSESSVAPQSHTAYLTTTLLHARTAFHYYHHHTHLFLAAPSRLVGFLIPGCSAATVHFPVSLVMATLNANPIIYEARDDSADTSAFTPEHLPSLFSAVVIPLSVLTGPAPPLSSFFPLTASSLPDEPFAFSDSASPNKPTTSSTSHFFSHSQHSTPAANSFFRPSPASLSPFSALSVSSPSSRPASVRDPWDALEVFDLVRSINDPEHPLTLEQLNVTQLPLITVDDAASHISIHFTPTIPHCSMATLIGLCIRVKLIRSLPRRFKVDITITKGAHATEDAINKQLNDKERVAAALENNHLLDIVNKCLASKAIDL